MIKVINVRLSIIFVLFGIVLLFGCITPPQPPTNITNIPVLSNQTPVPNSSNSNASPYPIAPPLSQDPSVEFGDIATVDYKLWVNGTLYDTSLPELANQSVAYNPLRKYTPMTYSVELNKGVITGFIVNTVGLSLNDTLAFDVDPKHGYGVYDPTKVIIIPRTYNMSLYETVPRSDIDENKINLTKGAGFKTNVGTVFISELNDTTVTFFYLLTAGKEFTANNLDQKVLSIGNLSATIEYMLELNKSYILPDPKTNAMAKYLVTDINDQNITLDSNSPLAGKTLSFEVRLLSIQRRNETISVPK